MCNNVHVHTAYASIDDAKPAVVSCLEAKRGPTCRNPALVSAEFPSSLATINNASFKQQLLARPLLHLLDFSSCSSCSIDTGSISIFQIPTGHLQDNSKVSSMIEDVCRNYAPAPLTCS